MREQSYLTVNDYTKEDLTSMLDQLFSEGSKIVSITRTTPFRTVASQQRYVDDKCVADYLIVFE